LHFGEAFGRSKKRLLAAAVRIKHHGFSVIEYAFVRGPTLRNLNCLHPGGLAQQFREALAACEVIMMSRFIDLGGLSSDEHNLDFTWGSVCMAGRGATPWKRNHESKN
jgi:hypothetical protein